LDIEKGEQPSKKESNKVNPSSCDSEGGQDGEFEVIEEDEKTILLDGL
jgi:hypothetical protein